MALEVLKWIALFFAITSVFWFYAGPPLLGMLFDWLGSLTPASRRELAAFRLENKAKHREWEKANRLRRMKAEWNRPLLPLLRIENRVREHRDWDRYMTANPEAHARWIAEGKAMSNYFGQIEAAEANTSRYSEREIVYVLERLTSEGRFFKIGKTMRSDVSRRAYEVRSTIVSYTNSVRERDVHRELRQSRVNRSQLPAEITDAHGPTEWFRPTPEVERFAFEGILPSGRTATMVADRAAA